MGCDLKKGKEVVDYEVISIHAPRVGCDDFVGVLAAVQDGFQSTHPVWGATCDIPASNASIKHISIHAPRVGCDSKSIQGTR